MTAYVALSGQTVSGRVLKNDDTLIVYSGGTAFSTTVSVGATEFIYSAGLDRSAPATASISVISCSAPI